jgi:pSer/pThr/pTyr-binding forkhead associated (FHA) protein
MSIDVPRSEQEQAALATAASGPCPFVVLRDQLNRQLIVLLSGDQPRTIGRRAEADISLPWDKQVSRLHAELRCLAGEWTINDDGLSQNGTYVNEVRLVGRRRLFDGDDVRVGQTRLAFHDPSATATGLTLLPGELNATTAFSEQQHAVLRELCRPFAQDGDRVRAGSDREIGEALGLPARTVANELAALYDAFGVADLPDGTARKEVARTALATGIVSFEDLI